MGTLLNSASSVPGIPTSGPRMDGGAAPQPLSLLVLQPHADQDPLTLVPPECQTSVARDRGCIPHSPGPCPGGGQFAGKRKLEKNFGNTSKAESCVTLGVSARRARSGRGLIHQTLPGEGANERGNGAWRRRPLGQRCWGGVASAPTGRLSGAGVAPLSPHKAPVPLF